jgi:BASS family bile acid:Na+ symporter
MAVLRTLITILSWLYLVSMMFGLGLELGGGPKESKAEKRSQRYILLRGLVLNLVVLPFIAFAVTRALHTSSEVSIALLLLVAAPGGRYAPHIVKLGVGNVPLAVELTLFLAKLTAFTAPPTAQAMLTLHSLEVRELPFVLQLILLQLVPYYFGRWLRRTHEPTAARLLRPAQRTALVLALAAAVVVLVKGDRGVLQLLADRGWIAVGIIVIVSPLLGWLAGGARSADRRALSISANARELALALVLANLAYPNSGVHTALFGIWSLMSLACVAVGGAMHAFGGEKPRFTAGGRAPAVPAGARSGPVR